MLEVSCTLNTAVNPSLRIKTHRSPSFPRFSLRKSEVSGMSPVSGPKKTASAASGTPPVARCTR